MLGSISQQASSVASLLVSVLEISMGTAIKFKFGPTSGPRKNILLHFRSIITTRDQKEEIIKDAQEKVTPCWSDSRFLQSNQNFFQVFSKLSTLFNKEII